MRFKEFIWFIEIEHNDGLPAQPGQIMERDGKLLAQSNVNTIERQQIVPSNSNLQAWYSPLIVTVRYSYNQSEGASPSPIQDKWVGSLGFKRMTMRLQRP